MKIVRHAVRRMQARPGAASGRIAAPALASLVVTTAAVLGCKPTAIVVPQIAALAAVESPGTVASECDYTALQTSYLLRFAMRDTEGRLVEPGDQLIDFTVELGDTFTSEDLEVIGNAGRLYPSPDVVCAADADCTAQGLEGYTCGPVSEQDGADVSVPRVCGRPVTVNLDRNAGFDYIPALPVDDRSGRDRIGRAVTTLFFDGSTALGQSYLNPGAIEVAYRTDPLTKRSTGLITLLRRLGDVESPFAGQVDFCFGTFHDNVVDFIDEDGQAAEGGNCLHPLSEGSDGFIAYQTAAQTRAVQGQAGSMNYWAALDAAITDMANNAEEGFHRHIVLYVDGDITFPETRESNTLQGLTFDNVLADAIQAGISVHVIQLDNPTLDGMKWGPILDLSELACATGGTFQYVERPDSLEAAFQSLAYTLAASYEISIQLGDVGVPLSGTYKLSFSLQVTLDDAQETLRFGGWEASNSARADRRVTVTMNRTCAADTDCLGGSTCVDTVCTNPLALASEGSGE